MNIWAETRWKKRYHNNGVRKGLRLKCDPDIDDEVRRACKEFCKSLRARYYFPIRIPIYLKASDTIKAKDGDMVCGTFFEPDDPMVEPYIRIATGDYELMLKEYGKDDALASILQSIAHEITHYYQWVNSSIYFGCVRACHGENETRKC